MRCDCFSGAHDAMDAAERRLQNSSRTVERLRCRKPGSQQAKRPRGGQIGGGRARLPPAFSIAARVLRHSTSTGDLKRYRRGRVSFAFGRRDCDSGDSLLVLV